MVDTRLAFSVVVACALCSGGCGKGDGLVTVEGVVTLDGQPLPNINVVFDQPELSVKDNIGYIGKTDSQGRYELSPTGTEGAGAPPGKYRVSLSTAYDPSAPLPPGARPTTIFVPAEPPPPPERVPAAYRGGKLSFEVPADGTDQANFALKSKEHLDQARGRLILPLPLGEVASYRAGEGNAREVER